MEQLDEIDLSRKRRGMIAFGIIIFLIIIFSILLFFWGNINKGKLEIIADTPFTVQIFGFETVDCPTSPCRITHKPGIKDLILTKEGSKTIVTQAKIKRWKTSQLKIDFQITPKLSEAKLVPKKDEIKYELVNDKEKALQKLIKSDDKNQRAIVYFSKTLQNSKIFGDHDYLAVATEDGVYKVDLRTKSRSFFSGPNLSQILSGKWSEDGRYLAFDREGFVSPWILDSQTADVKQLNIINKTVQTAWTYDNALVFVTAQNYEAAYENEITLLAQTVAAISVGAYNPDEDKYYLYETFDQLSKLPDEISVTKNGQNVYFTIDEQNYQVTLKTY